MGRLGPSRTVALENTLQHLGMVIHSQPRLSNSAISAFTLSPNSSQRSMSREVSSPRDRFGPAFIPAMRKTLLFVGETHVGSSPSSPTCSCRFDKRLSFLEKAVDMNRLLHNCSFDFGDRT